MLQAKTIFICFGWLVSFCLVLLAPTTTDALKYGAGSYGRCQYQTCAITMSSSGTISVNVTPSSSGTKCSIAKDTVTVTTSATVGYNLKLIDANTSNVLNAGSNNINATTGTYATPVVLANNTWGYRVDGSGTFGAGPTSVLTNGAVPSLTFASVKLSSGTADTIVTTSTAASSGSITNVWYGLCATTAVPSATYSDSVVYTALTN